MAGLRHPHREDGRSAPPNWKDFQRLSARLARSAHFAPPEYIEWGKLGTKGGCHTMPLKISRKETYKFPRFLVDIVSIECKITLPWNPFESDSRKIPTGSTPQAQESFPRWPITKVLQRLFIYPFTPCTSLSLSPLLRLDSNPTKEHFSPYSLTFTWPPHRQTGNLKSTTYS